MAVIIGVDALVPPTTISPGAWKLSNTRTPVAGLATAATSFWVLLGQPPGGSKRCHDGLTWFEQPEAVPRVPLADPQTDSVQPRPLVVFRSVVPPTDVTYCRLAGNVGPYPRSPDAKLMTLPGWLKKWLKWPSPRN